MLLLYPICRYFTLDQIDSFIKLANKRGSTACTATLLDFKNANFPDYDPVAELML